MRRLKHLLRQAEFHRLLFAMGLIVFSWPFAGSVAAPHPISVFLYLFVPWGVIIFLLFLISQSLAISPSPEPDDDQEKQRRKE